MNENEFDLVDELDRTLKTLGLSRHDAVSELVVDGQDPLVPSTIRLGSAMGIALLSSAVGAAQIWQAATGRRQRLGLDLGQALHQLTPYLGGGNTLNGYGSNMGSVLGLGGTPAPALWDLYRTADDRWAIPIACYPHTRDTFLDLLGTEHAREHIGAADRGPGLVGAGGGGGGPGCAPGDRPQPGGVPRPSAGPGRSRRTPRGRRAGGRRPAASAAGR